MTELELQRAIYECSVDMCYADKMWGLCRFIPPLADSYFEDFMAASRQNIRLHNAMAKYKGTSWPAYPGWSPDKKSVP